MDILLTNLPVIIFFWTACTFCWGVLTNIALLKLINDTCIKRGARKSDLYSIWVILVMCTVDALYLYHEPIVTSLFSDSIVVLNIFCNAFLACVWITIVKWWEAIKPANIHTNQSDSPFKVVP